MVRGSKKGLVVITGSAGRIGSAVAKRLGEKYNIVGFELMRAIYASKNEELVPLDIASEESVNQAFKHIESFYGRKITAVVHLAAFYSFEDTRYKNYKEITVEGTRRILKALKRFDVEQFIFSSTMLVHKWAKPGKKIKENSPLEGNWAYPRSKIETERVIHEHRGKTPSVVMRISGVYDNDCHSIPISNQIQRIHENHLTSHIFPGDRSRGASFMHMDDLVDLIEKTIAKRKSLPKSTTLEVGEPKTFSTQFLQNEISMAIHGKESWMVRIPKWLAKVGSWFQCHTPFMAKPFIRPWMIRLCDEHYELDISKARRLLGWEPKHSLDKEVKKMCRKMLKDPKKWYEKNGLKLSHKIKRELKKRPVRKVAREKLKPVKKVAREKLRRAA